jgi:hypothetical protein
MRNESRDAVPETATRQSYTSPWRYVGGRTVGEVRVVGIKQYTSAN